MTDLNLPNFLIVGAMKCGTSTLYRQIRHQRGVFMTEPKEPNFFSDDAVFSMGDPWYRALFSGATDFVLRGEASTHYSKLPKYPDTVPRMQALLDKPRIIYIIRNPIERLVSHFIHQASLGAAPDSLEAAIASDAGYVAYGRYAMQIAPYVDWLGHDRIHILSLEMLTKKPEEQIASIGRFLESPTPFDWNASVAHMNESAERLRQLPLHQLLVSNSVAESLRRALVPRSWREFAKQRIKMGTERPVLSRGLRSELEDIFTRDAVKLLRLFPGNRTISMTHPFIREARE